MIVAARSTPKLQTAGLAGVLAGVLLVSGCTSGGGSENDGAAPGSPTTAAAPANLEVKLVTVAKVPPGDRTPRVRPGRPPRAGAVP